MTEMGVGVQNYWLPATLLVLCGILSAVVWYGRKILSALRASQEQIGALLKLSISDTPAEKSSPARSGSSFELAGALHSLAGVPVRANAAVSGPATAILPETESPGIGTRASAWSRGVIRWLRTPMGKREPSGRLLRWLQAPVRS